MRVCPILQFNAACQAYLCINLLELLDPVRKGNDLGGTDEGEVEGVEEEHHILPSIVGQFDLEQNCYKYYSTRLAQIHCNPTSLNSPLTTAVPLNSGAFIWGCSDAIMDFLGNETLKPNFWLMLKMLFLFRRQ